MVMNKPMAVWGLLLFIGFLTTHYFVFSADTFWITPLWIVLAVIGCAFQCTGCCCMKGKDSKKGKKCSCGCRCCSDLWAVAIVEGLIVTVAIAIGLLQISAFYILSVWLLTVGAAMVASSLRDKKAMKMELGIFWMLCAVFFPFVGNYQPASLILGALIFGVPMMAAGIAQKE